MPGMDGLHGAARSSARPRPTARSSCSPPPARRRTCSPRSAAARPAICSSPSRRSASPASSRASRTARPRSPARSPAACSTRCARGNDRGTGVPDAIAEALSAREVEVLLLLDDHLGTDEIAGAPLHLRAHRPLAREEPAAQAQRLVAPRGARAARASPAQRSEHAPVLTHRGGCVSPTRGHHVPARLRPMIQQVQRAPRTRGMAEVASGSGRPPKGGRWLSQRYGSRRAPPATRPGSVSTL